MIEDSCHPMVLVVDDDEAMRDSICYLLESVNLPCKAFASAHEFMEFCDARLQGCILLDIRMPGMNGMELLENLKAQGIKLPVIIITGHGDVPLAVRAMKQGAFDFLQKPFPSQTLLDRVYAAIESLRENHQKTRQMDDLRSSFDSLTNREKEIMEMVVAGSSSKVIGMTLGISSKTVDIHRSSIMKKLDVRNVAELVQRRLALQDEQKS
ncbi:MAG: response regulator transcription factor [Sideroxydans sp.]